MNEIIRRLRSRTPLFFRRLQRIAAALFALSLFLKEQEHDFAPFGISLVAVGIGANAVAVLVAQLAVDDGPA